MLKKILFVLLFLPYLSFPQSKILIYMDLKQTNCLRAYGITYHALARGETADWLLNYRGGSFMLNYTDKTANDCRVEGVAFDALTAAEAAKIYSIVQDVNNNMAVVRLEKAPKIAVYVPPDFRPWDDAVTLALNYAKIPYTKIWNDQILHGDLSKYDWLHLHHEDFTGEFGKFYASFSNAQWYIDYVREYEQDAKKNGFKKVSNMMKAVAQDIKDYVGRGGFLFAMCSATETLDIALAAEHTDICPSVFDGDPPDPDAQQKLDFSNTLAFTNFKVIMNPYVYDHSSINVTPSEVGSKENDYFTLFDFSAKYDPVPTMLTQDQVNVIHGFMGQTTAFHKKYIKRDVIIMGEKKGTDQVKYIHGNFGRGTFTFYGGHDPADYVHYVGDPPTDLSLHKNSPGYRLILNNVLFPAARPKKQKT